MVARGFKNIYTCRISSFRQGSGEGSREGNRDVGMELKETGVVMWEVAMIMRRRVEKNGQGDDVDGGGDVEARGIRKGGG